MIGRVLMVLTGFVLALFQIVSHKSEAFTLKTKLRRVQIELDTLRNENIDDNIELEDEIDNNL